MTVQERRERERARRHRLIVDTARRLAEDEGWAAVTTRRLAALIEYSQPVLYSHFANMEAIANAVAMEGFAELATTLAEARANAAPEQVAHRIAQAYVDFGVRQPAVYDAMFVQATDIAFGSPDTPEPLRRAFAELVAAVEQLSGPYDPETDAEVFWSALHGLVMLGRSRRLRPDREGERLELLLERFSRLWAPGRRRTTRSDPPADAGRALHHP
ncbi:TetR/AcrR family transcriptional regulator [Nocardia cyriacigeorgica]|uniref:TetR/AcrR family transcriptional regulator n=1 Tax=Nocardia cyriacigeorgica TaxID=135487 RepID=UPI002456C8C1|nr:TetR/AcrR family transcriptional regulator [Nocardia cyriacigeorgica]